jgi:hypothetical protein
VNAAALRQLAGFPVFETLGWVRQKWHRESICVDEETAAMCPFADDVRPFSCEVVVSREDLCFRRCGDKEVRDGLVGPGSHLDEAGKLEDNPLLVKRRGIELLHDVE